MKNIIKHFYLFFICFSSFATDYYFANNGSDTNNGTAASTPFQTIDKLNAIRNSFLPGDKILFRRGDIFRGQIEVSKSGTLSSKIIYGAYGNGDRPVISGAKQVNIMGWTDLTNGFWQVSHLDKINHLFKSEQIQVSARFPNVGYATINSTNGAQNGTSTITSAVLTQPANQWNGATVHVRNQGDAITKSTITGFQGSTISFVGTGYQIAPNFGFYIDNSENALDVDGEWFWNETTKILKIKSSTNPGQSQFEGSFTEYGIRTNWSVSHIVIEDLKFSYQTNAAIDISFSNGIIIKNNIFKYCNNGVRAGGYTNTEVLNLQILDNVFHDILNTSISTNPWVNFMTISRNEIKRNALIPGYEEPCLVCGQALYITGNDSSISENSIEDCGYAAINYFGKRNIIEKNWIKNTGLSKNDCGSIQSWGHTTSNNIIRNNFCSQFSGNIEGMPANYGIIAKGVYLDNYQSANTIENNTCFDSPNGAGIFLYSVRDNIVKNNTAYNNNIQISLAERNPNTSPGNEQAAFYVLSTNNTVTDNIGYCLTASQRSITTHSDHLGTANFGTFNNNYWFNPYSGTIATNMSTEYTLQSWRNATNRDLQSTEHFLKRSPIESVTTVGTNLITNGTFDTNLNGWSAWQGHVNLSVGQDPTFGSSVLNFVGNSGGAQNYANLQSPNFAVESGSNYILRFKGKSTNYHVMGVQNAMAVDPWWNIATGTNVVLDTSVRDYVYMFTPTQSQNPARIGFVQNVPATTTVDDFSLFKYSSIVFENSKQRSPLFINPSAMSLNISLTGTYRDLQNNVVSGTLVLPPWSSRILVRTENVLAGENPTCNASTTFSNGTWSNGLPDGSKSVIFSSNFTANSNLTACSVSVSGTANVVFPSGFSLTVTNSVSVATSASLTFENNANLLQTSNATNIGKVIVKRNAAMRRQDYVFWGSPVANQFLKAFSPETLDTRFYTYSEPSNGFVVIPTPAATTFDPAKGYMLRAPNTFPLYDITQSASVFNGSFTGIPNNGLYTIGATNSGANFGNNLLSNPYPSTLDANLFLAQNPGTLYFWTHTAQGANVGTNYASYNSSGGTKSTAIVPSVGSFESATPNGTVQIGQGFIYRTSQARSLQFNNAMRVGNNTGQFFRNSNTIERHRIWLTMTGSETSNQILVGYITGATNGFDESFDGIQIATGTAISSTIGSQNFVIQGRSLPFANTDVVPLDLKVEAAGNFSLKVDEVDGLFLGTQNIFLKDNLTGITHNIKTSPYNFTSAIGTFANRFELVYANIILGLEDPSFDANNVFVFKKGNSIIVNTGFTEMDNVVVFDLQGRKIIEKTNINATETKLDLVVQQQILLVKITTIDNQVITKKIVY